MAVSSSSHGLNISLLFRVSLFVGVLMTMAQGFQHSQIFSRPPSLFSPHGTTTTTTRLALPRLRRELQVLRQSARPLERSSGINGDVSSNSEESMSLEERKRELAAISKQEDSGNNEVKKSATVASSTMSLIKVIVGTGILALPYGVAAVSDYPIALVPASALLLVLGAFSAYTFQLYGRLAHETQAKNMVELWEITKGKRSSWIVSASTFSFCFGIAVAYSLVIGAFLSKLALSFGSGLPALLGRRQFWILSVTLSTLAPLCNLKSLAALAPMSILGTVGSLLTASFMALRCPAIFAASPYSVASGAVGKFAAVSFKATPALAPQFNTFSKILSPASLIIAAMATTAYLGHFNAVDFYRGFTNSKSTTNETSGEEPLVAASSAVHQSELDERNMAIKKFGKMTSIAFPLVILLNILVMSSGFLTFGGNCAGVVLNNYATADPGAVVSRFLMTLSVIGGYPFMIRACKSTFVQLYNDFKGEVGEKPTMEKWVGRVLLAIATSISLLISNAGLVISLIGALMGSAIIYVFPSLMFLSHTAKQMKQVGFKMSTRLRFERLANRFLVTFGVVSGILGAAVSIADACAPHLLC